MQNELKLDLNNRKKQDVLEKETLLRYFPQQQNKKEYSEQSSFKNIPEGRKLEEEQKKEKKDI